MNAIREDSFEINDLFSACESPSYIEARERETKRDWTGSDSILIHLVESSKEWAAGYSKDFGLVEQYLLNENLQL